MAYDFVPKNAPKKFGDMTTKDLDLLDTTSILEFQRGLIISHYESNFYDMYPLLSARQSRLPMSEHTLTVAEALNSHPFKDTVAQAYSDFDPHHFHRLKYRGARCFCRILQTAAESIFHMEA